MAGTIKHPFGWVDFLDPNGPPPGADGNATTDQILAGIAPWSAPLGASPLAGTPSVLSVSSAAGGAAPATSNDGTIVLGPPSLGGGSPFVIIAQYDTSITTLSATLAAAIEQSVTGAIAFYESQILTNETLTIDFAMGNLEGDIGHSNYDVSTTTYSAIHNELTAHANAVGLTSIGTMLPTADPISTSNTWYVNSAEQGALTAPGSGTNDIGLAGTVSIDSTTSYVFGSTNTAVSGYYDAVGVFEHEISEVLGREQSEGVQGAVFGVADDYMPYDLFRFSAAGTPLYGQGSAYASINNGTTSLGALNDQVSNGDLADWNSTVVNDSYDNSANPGAANTVSANDLTVLEALGFTLCFLAGTKIATPSGPVPVQDLRSGDIVRTASGADRPIVWIGQGEVLATPGRQSAATPVIVRKGALAPNVPWADLRVTKGHAFLLDGVLIPAEFLVNHRSVVWDEHTKEVKLFHIELETHDVLIANGAPAESYRDDGNRWLFRNANTGWDQPAKPPCAPVLTGGPLVDAAWRRLLDQAGGRPGVELTDDADLHLRADGRRIEGIRDDRWIIFCLPSTSADIRIASRSACPDRLGLVRDSRELGVAIRTIAIRQIDRDVWIDAADDRLVAGFHDYERDLDIRWTNGDAAIPANLLDGFSGPVELAILIGGSTRYLDAGKDLVAA